MASYDDDDPRMEKLNFQDKSWLKFWHRRIVEINAEGDALWDDPNPEVRLRSKRVNLASLVRKYGGGAAAIIARPMGQAHETAEFAVLRTRYDSLEPK
jgi:hypothetical protein